jgi:predicted house-cleaning NTP pyrophosphatase (Maf/HAM1 superfamily)
VIGADTVVLTHAQPVSSNIAYSELPGVNQELLEKPVDGEDNLRMLQDLNGNVCEVVTGVSLGERHHWTLSTDGSDIDSFSFSRPDITRICYTVGFLCS